MIEIVAKLNHLRMSPRKVRVVADLIRGLDVRSAKAQLSLMPRKAAGLLLKLLNSAIANAKHNFNLPEESLTIGKIMVNGGPSLKRWMPRAMGRAAQIMKRTSHVYLTLLGSEKAVSPKASGNVEKDRDQLLKPRAAVGQVTSEVNNQSMTEKNNIIKSKITAAKKPDGAASDSKKRHFSRQTLLNLKKDANKIFRRKSV